MGTVKFYRVLFHADDVEDVDEAQLEACRDCPRGYAGGGWFMCMQAPNELCNREKEARKHGQND